MPTISERLRAHRPEVALAGSFVACAGLIINGLGTSLPSAWGASATGLGAAAALLSVYSWIKEASDQLKRLEKIEGSLDAQVLKLGLAVSRIQYADALQDLGRHQRNALTSGVEPVRRLVDEVIPRLLTGLHGHLEKGTPLSIQETSLTVEIIRSLFQRLPAGTVWIGTSLLYEDLAAKLARKDHRNLGRDIHARSERGEVVVCRLLYFGDGDPSSEVGAILRVAAKSGVLQRRCFRKRAPLDQTLIYVPVFDSALSSDEVSSVHAAIQRADDPLDVISNSHELLAILRFNSHGGEWLESMEIDGPRSAGASDGIRDFLDLWREAEPIDGG